VLSTNNICGTCRSWKLEGYSPLYQSKACFKVQNTLAEDSCSKWKRSSCLECSSPLVGYQQRKFCTHKCSDDYNRKTKVLSPCLTCGSLLETVNVGRNPKYCDECRARDCKNCGEEFVPSRPKQRFCSFDCFLTPEVNCEECGDLFQARTHNAKRCDACYTQHCECGCGTLIAYPREVKSYYAPGHWIRDEKNISVETRAKWSRAFHSWAWKPNSLELRVLDQLDPAFFAYAGQKQIDRGQPISSDIICLDAKLIVLVDGCHWHECPAHGNGMFPKKPSKDAQLTLHAQKLGWAVLRFWEHEINENVDLVTTTIASTREQLLAES